MAVSDRTKTLSKRPEPIESVPVLVSQSKRPELGRFLLQVDRQTKGSYPNSEAAQVAGLAIKTGHPILQVVVYDALECVGKPIGLAET